MTMIRKLKLKLKQKWNAFKYWWNDDYEGYQSNGEAYSNAFFAGSGMALWYYVIIFGIYCLITGQKLGFVKK